MQQPQQAGSVRVPPETFNSMLEVLKSRLKAQELWQAVLMMLQAGRYSLERVQCFISWVLDLCVPSCKL